MLLRALGSLTLLALALPGLAKPNFTGDWKLNTSKSTFGQMPAPEAMTVRIQHDDPKLSTTTNQRSQMGNSQRRSDYLIDSKEPTNDDFGGATMKTIVKWEGDNLAFETKGQFNGRDVTMTQKWTLAEDGKSYTVQQTIKSEMGEFQQTLFFEKQ